MIAAGTMLFLPACSSTKQGQPHASLRTAAKVDVTRYSGKWYEIARYPQWFQKGCASATAEYSGKPDGSIRVFNTCLKADGGSRSIEGSAVPVDASNTRLRVSFSTKWYARFIPIPDAGNYWIIDVTPDYRHAIVGTPDRKTLWLLSRSPRIPAKELTRMKKIAESQGFDPQKLVVDSHTKIVGN